VGAVASSGIETAADGLAARERAGARNVVDLEMSAGADSHMGLRLWLRMLTTTNLIQAELRKRLRLEFGSTLPRFDLMAQLERNPGGLKMNELSRRLMVTGGNVTGITDQLEKEGLVAREVDPQDRRSITVRLTPAGSALFDRMATAHERWVVELLGGLGLGEKSALHEKLGALKQHLLENTARRA
jgi:DNA-binding MarR family transcriptional regulator